MSQMIDGGCLCGRVRYRAAQPPLRTLVCHCSFCQRVTGSLAYSESLFPMDAVQFSGAPMRSYAHRSDSSGKKVVVHFCESCGTTVSLSFERWPDVRAISRGTMDVPGLVEVTAHIWTRSAQSGGALPAGIDCFDQARASLHGTAQTPRRFDVPVMVEPRPEARSDHQDGKGLADE